MEELTDIQKNALVELANNLVLKNPPLPLLKETGFHPIIHVIEDILIKLHSSKKLLLPNLRYKTETISILSDYGGESNDSQYKTYSFLFCSHNNLGLFDNRMTRIRDQYGLNKPLKEITYKDMHYGPLSRAVSDYLIALNNYVPGLLFTLILEKGISSVFSSNSPKAQRELAALLDEADFGVWKKQGAEKLLLVVHIIAYFLALLSMNKQGVFWMTDNDEIAANSDRFNRTLNLLYSILPVYTTNTFTALAGATPFVDKHPETMDLLSATDIVAGAFEHLYTTSLRRDQTALKEAARKAVVWHINQGIFLKKLVIVIRRDENGEPIAASLEFEPNMGGIDHDLSNGISVPVHWD
jgi:hypothetical protein